MHLWQAIPSLNSHEDTENLVSALEQFATEGLRTLVITKREVEAGQAKAWLAEYFKARNDVGNREQSLSEVAQSIEVDLEALGATAIEDRLQVGVCVWCGVVWCLIDGEWGI